MKYLVTVYWVPVPELGHDAMGDRKIDMISALVKMTVLKRTQTLDSILSSQVGKG